MASNPIKLGAVGFGRHFRRSLLPNIVSTERFVLAAVAERSDDLRAAVSARMPGCEVYADAVEMIADADLDAVVVCADPSTHVAMTRAAIERGRDVFVEKPAGLNAAELRELHDLAVERGVVAMTGTMWRYAPPVTILTDWMKTRVATVELLDIAATFPRPDAKEEWGLDALEAAFYEMFIHAFDWAAFVIGDIEDVDAVAAPSMASHHHVSVRLRATSGALACLSLTAGSEAYQVRSWAALSEGSLAEIDTLEKLVVTANPAWSATDGSIRDRPTLQWEPGQHYRGFGRKGYAEELTAFADAVVSREMPIGNLATHASAIEGVERALRCIRPQRV